MSLAKVRADMLRMKAFASVLFAAVGSLASFGSLGSTCHGSSNGANGADESGAATAETPADVTLPGVDTSMLTTRERREYASYVTAFLAPCSNVPVSVAQCIQEKRDCSRCLPAAKYVLDGVRKGGSPDQIEKAYHARFDADKVKNVPIDGSSYKGPDSAPVTLVEFADFECPYCALMSPVLEKSWQAHNQDLRYVYKFMPLAGHPHGEISARAGIAAMMQGKFWEMHDKMFANREHLEPADLEGYAKEIGLDVARFKKDAESQATTDIIATDRKQADALGVKGTPTIYINGREFDVRQDLDDWIAQELGPDAKPPIPLAPSTVAPGSASSASTRVTPGSSARPAGTPPPSTGH